MNKLIDDDLTDKNTIHSYLATYEKLFEPIKEKTRNVLEIGIWKGGSIKLWSDYFKNSRIHAIDIMYPPEYIIGYPRVTCYGGDAYSKQFVEIMSANKYDVIIDDGPHTLESMCFTARYYSDLLTSDGILVIEDIQDIEWCKDIKEALPENLRNFSYIVDLREEKGRYDDILFIVDLNSKR